jgi:hypothetical protein
VIGQLLDPPCRVTRAQLQPLRSPVIRLRDENSVALVVNPRPDR